VLAIDYGTTFTGKSSLFVEGFLPVFTLLGLAWMQTDGQREPQFSDLILFRDWPTRIESKVPSEVSYSLVTAEAAGECKQWGFSIYSRSKVLRWTKLELVKGRLPLEELEALHELVDGLAEVTKLHTEGAETADIPRHLSKSAEDIIEFYLGHVAREWQDWVLREMKVVLDEVPVDIVVTHPAVSMIQITNSQLSLFAYYTLS
jgi:hypothetical protein